MKKEVLIYGSINEYSSALYITAMEAAADDDISVRVNTTGGSPEYGWGMIAKFSEHKGAKLVKADGQAHSMGSFFMCYADKGSREALDVCEFLIHRAAYSPWFEDSMMDDVMWGNLDRINASLKKAFTNTVDVKAFEEIANEQIPGVTIDDIFSNEDRKEIFLTAKQAKKIGLIDRIIPITPAKRTEISSYMKAASSLGEKHSSKPEDKKPNPKINPMTKEEFKAQHPAIYAAILIAGKKIGISKERDRIGACMAYADVDLVGVKAAIASGEPLSQTAIAEFNVKMANPERLKNVEKDSEGKTLTTEEIAAKQKTETEKQAAKYESDLDSKLGLGKK